VRERERERERIVMCVLMKKDAYERRRRYKRDRRGSMNKGTRENHN
jgi:hypothetical protein